MEKEKKYITQDNYEVLSDRIVFYPKKENNEYRVCSDLANEVPDQVSIFVEKENCEKCVQWLNTLQTPIQASNTPNLASKTILDDIHPHEVDRLVFWEQYKDATDDLNKMIALIGMLQEDDHIINKLKSYVHDTTK